MRRLRKLIQQYITCNHGLKTADNVVEHANGRTYYAYRTKCLKCGRVKRGT